MLNKILGLVWYDLRLEVINYRKKFSKIRLVLQEEPNLID